MVAPFGMVLKGEIQRADSAELKPVLTTYIITGLDNAIQLPHSSQPPRCK
jgi:hypothetical protein